MRLQQKFALKLFANLPEEGFSLDELVIETKKLLTRAIHIAYFA